MRFRRFTFNTLSIMIGFHYGRNPVWGQRFLHVAPLPFFGLDFEFAPYVNDQLRERLPGSVMTDQRTQAIQATERAHRRIKGRDLTYRASPDSVRKALQDIYDRALAGGEGYVVTGSMLERVRVALESVREPEPLTLAELRASQVPADTKEKLTVEEFQELQRWFETAPPSEFADDLADKLGEMEKARAASLEVER